MQPKWRIILCLVVASSALTAVSFGDNESAPGQEKKTSNEQEAISEQPAIEESMPDNSVDISRVEEDNLEVEEEASGQEGGATDKSEAVSEQPVITESAPDSYEDAAVKEKNSLTIEDVVSAADALTPNKEEGNPNPGTGIRSPNSKTYEKLSAEWWKWSLSMPVTEHPLYDTADGSEGQSGKVWFIGSGVVNEMGPAGEYIVNVPNREITIPPGTKLFMPLFNVEGSTIEGVPEEELESYAQSFPQYVTEMSATVDGIEIGDLEKYDAPSAVFNIGPLPADNILGAAEGAAGKSAADGYYLMLPPLTPGEHTIYYTSKLEMPGENGEPNFVFIQDVAYTVIVEPKS